MIKKLKKWWNDRKQRKLAKARKEELNAKYDNTTIRECDCGTLHRIYTETDGCSICGGFLKKEE